MRGIEYTPARPTALPGSRRPHLYEAGVRARSTAERVLAVLGDEPVDVHEMHRLVARDAGKYGVHPTMSVVRTVLGRLVDVGQITRDRRDGDSGDGAGSYRCVSEAPAPAS